MALPPPLLCMDGTPPCTPRVVGKGLPETPMKGGGLGVVVPQRSESPELPKTRRKVKTKLSMSTSISKGVLGSSVLNGTPDVSSLMLGESTEFSGQSSRGAESSWFNSQFRLVTEIGCGNFGKVVEVVSNLEGMHYAVKIVNASIKSKQELAKKTEEAKALARCDHQNIIRYYGCWVEDRHLYIQCEFCSGGSLEQRMRTLRDQKKIWPEQTVTALLLQITSALEYLHTTVRIAHLDVKPENIYLHSDETKFKLGDFGHAHFLDSTPVESPLPRCSLDSWASDVDVRFSLEEGDIRYLPLEMLNEKSFLPEADVFSLGMSLYEILTGIPPPKGAEAPWRSIRETAPLPETITSLSYSPKLALSTVAMIRRDPKSRPTTRDILSEFQEEHFEMLTMPWKYLGSGDSRGREGSGMANAP